MFMDIKKLLFHTLFKTFKLKKIIYLSKPYEKIQCHLKEGERDTIIRLVSML